VFGNRAKISAEELAYMKEQLDNDRGFFENVNAKSKLIEADFDELEKSRQLEESSLKQLNDNANNVVEFSKDSMDAISALNDSFTECVKAAADNLTSLEGAAKAIATQHEDTCALVENNKHFTAPAKSLSETSDRLEEHVDSCADIAAQMKEQNKQMSVLSLNAAIEAGMLGEQGKLFVEAAESIREASVSYDSAIDAVKQELSEAKAEISALKEQVSHLVGLLKDNNVATTKLMCFHSVMRFQLT
jgi:methyl-accepting chemotaxis protein